MVIRTHDIYLASPSGTVPGINVHTVGALWLPPDSVGGPRCLSAETRAAKIEEIDVQLRRLDEMIVGPYVCGDLLTLADFAIWPTFVYLLHYLPSVFGWKDVFYAAPNLRKWFALVTSSPEAARVRGEMQAVLDGVDSSAVREVVMREKGKWAFP